MSLDQHITTSTGDAVCVTRFAHGRHISKGYLVHHTDMSHAFTDGTVYGERVSVWLTAEGIAERSNACLKRHLEHASCAETNSTI